MIDTTLFVARGRDVRRFELVEHVAAPVEAVYAAWTDGDTFKRTYDPARAELSANIELGIGGRYEWLWDGVMGSNECQVLSYVPNRMLSFSWNAPPTQPESRALRTWVAIDFRAIDGFTTELTLTHLGFGDAPHWNETYDYFRAAWPHVLAQFKTNLERD